MTTEPRLKAKLWVQAVIRTAYAQDVTAVVARRGDPDAGAVLVKQTFGDGRCAVLSAVRTKDGALAWMRSTGPDPVDEAKADAYIARQVDIDYDLWVVEIEDRSGWLPPDMTLLP